MTATVIPQTSAGIKVEPLQYALGAYVTGVDLRRLDDAAFAAIHAAPSSSSSASISSRQSFVPGSGLAVTTTRGTGCMPIARS